MLNTYESDSELFQNLNTFLAEKKAEGKKVFAYFAHEFVPEEIIRAAGAVPLPLIFAGDEDRFMVGADLLTPSMCPFALSQIGSFLKREEDPKFRFLTHVDAIIATNYCAADNLVNEWIAKKNQLPALSLHIPFLRDPHHIKYYRHQIEILAQNMSHITGVSADAQKINAELESSQKVAGWGLKIAMSNLPGCEKLKLTQQLHIFGSDDPWNSDRSDFEKQIRSLKLWERSSSSKRVLMLGGAPVFVGDRLIDLIEESGAEMVMDATWLGIPYWKQRFLPIEAEGLKNDPYQILTNRFAEATASLHCAPRSVQAHASFLAENFKECRLSGLIYHIIKFCDISGHHRQQLKEIMTNDGIPILLLERDFSNSMIGQLQTRIEAFLEMIE